MLGKGWFPAELGGLDRYFRGLLEHRPEATGVVVGPATDAPSRVEAVSDHGAALPWRLLKFSLAAHRAVCGVAVVDTHFALYGLLPLLSPRVRRRPAIVHFHGPWADENVAQGDRLAIRRWLRLALERRVYRRATRVVVLSSAFRRVLIERYGVSPWRVRVEPPGVDLDHFSPGDRDRARERFTVPQDAFLAVCVRRLVPRMGMDVLIDAWARALPNLPRPACLLVAGDGPLRAELDEHIATARLRDSIRLLGRIDDDALVDLYRAADVGIVPTRAFEGFGLVVVEAAGCGTPTIVTRVGGLPEAVARLDRSLSVPPDDPPALAARIQRAALADGLPSRETTIRFAQSHSWPRIADRNRAVELEATAPGSADRRLRVVYLDHVGQLSGGEIALLRLVPHLVGVQPHFILAEDGPFADELMRAGISVEVLAMAEEARALKKGSVLPGGVPLAVAAGTGRYILRLALRLRRLRPDVVHANSLKAGVYGSFAARLAGVPLVWHVRDRISSDYLPGPAVAAIRFMTRHLASAVIANSRATMDTLDRAAQRLILHSVPGAPTTPPPARGELHSGPLTVGLIGRLAPWKGQDLFLRAFAEAFPVGDTRCALVGAALFGEDDYEQRLRELAEKLGIAGRVEFRGFCEDPWVELARMDVLVHASTIPEPFGQVILEGMTAGVPIIAADAGGPAELVSQGINGVLYPMGDQGALAYAMRRLAADPTHRQRLIDGGRASMGAHQPEKIGAQLEQLYREVLDKTAGKPVSRRAPPRCPRPCDPPEM